jgi:hypothetical protein
MALGGKPTLILNLFVPRMTLTYCHDTGHCRIADYYYPLGCLSDMIEFESSLLEQTTAKIQRIRLEKDIRMYCYNCSVFSSYHIILCD